MNRRELFLNFSLNCPSRIRLTSSYNINDTNTQDRGVILAEFITLRIIGPDVYGMFEITYIVMFNVFRNFIDSCDRTA